MNNMVFLSISHLDSPVAQELKLSSFSSKGLVLLGNKAAAAVAAAF